jgi:hypothetical protein
MHNLKTTSIIINAGKSTRTYPAVKACDPDKRVLQSVKGGQPTRDNNTSFDTSNQQHEYSAAAW